MKKFSTQTSTPKLALDAAKEADETIKGIQKYHIKEFKIDIWSCTEPVIECSEDKILKAYEWWDEKDTLQISLAECPDYKRNYQ
jgi:hypothetical protein